MQPQHDEQMLSFWQRQLQESASKPWLASILLQQSQEFKQRFNNYHSHLRALPRNWRRAISRRVSLGLAGAALLLALGSSPIPRAHAAEIIVDGSSCVLADAITAANTDTATGGCAAGSGADILYLQGDVNLTAALPDISSVITLEANGRTISRVDGSPEFSVLRVMGGELTLENATISGGASVTGGGIHVYGGKAFVRKSTISGNAADFGGGIYGYGGSITVNASTISGNNSEEGAGIFGSEVTLNVKRSTISGNTASASGGGIYASFGPTTVYQSTISGNSAAAYGGGVANIDGSTIVENSTISNNTAGYYGGGIYNAGSDASLTLMRSIIAGNSAARGAEIDNEEGGPITANNYNVVGYGGLLRSQNFTPVIPTDVIPDEPLSLVLGPLTDNGGPNKTHALFSGSPAVDLDASAACPVTDQRGVSRTVGRACDSGAYEYLPQLTQNIATISGWNLISAFVQPDNAALTAVLQPVQNDMILIKNAAGEVYWPAYGINQIGDWQAGAGYMIHMNNAATIVLDGKQLNPALNPIALNAGWNSVAYLRESAMPVDEALASISAELHLVKDQDGRIYWPEMGIINDLVDMEPGQAYQIHMNNPATLSYPGY